MSDRHHPAQSGGDPYPGWPAGVYPISIDGLNRVGVGDDGSLYWDGKPVEVRKSVQLTFAQKVGAVAVAISAVVAAASAAISAYVDIVSLR